MKARNLLVAALTLGAAVPSGLFSQQTPASPPPSRVIRLSYMKVEPARAAEYVQRLREHYKLIQQDRVARGKVTSWKVYYVSYPNGESQEYNYVLMTEYPSLGHLEDLSYAQNAKTVVGEEKYQSVLANPIAKSMRADTLTVRAATDGWVNATNRVMVVHYIRAFPGKGAEYIALQRSHHLPLNEDRVKAGGSTAWAATQLRFPEQRDHPYNYVSFNGYESLTQMEKQLPEWREKWRSKSAETDAQLRTLRTRVKGELWRLVDQTATTSALTLAPTDSISSPISRHVAGAVAPAGQLMNATEAIASVRTEMQEVHRRLDIRGFAQLHTDSGVLERQGLARPVVGHAALEANRREVWAGRRELTLQMDVSALDIHTSGALRPPPIKRCSIARATSTGDR